MTVRVHGSHDSRPQVGDQRRRLLVADLDGTLVGDDEALDRFGRWLEPLRDQYLLVYATGRHWPDVAAPVEAGSLPRPDAVIAAVGTEVHAADGSPWPGWAERFDPTHGDRARELLAGIPFLTLQPADRQSALKASWFLGLPGSAGASAAARQASATAAAADPTRSAAAAEAADAAHAAAAADAATAARLKRRVTGGRASGMGLGTPERRRHDHMTAIRDLLAEGGLTARLVVSASKYLDVLPPRSGKGAAARFLSEELGIEASRVLVFGDSGNDAELLLAGFPATIVANAKPELSAVRGPSIYRSPCSYADGVLDGITHWTAESALPRGLIQQ